MKYLLDVNVLVAWHCATHPKSARLHEWRGGNQSAKLFTCAIVELGFLRVLMQGYKYDRMQAEMALESIRKTLSGYVEKLPQPQLANWCAKGENTTDAYLCQVAKVNGLKLLTFDARIPDSSAALIQ